MNILVVGGTRFTGVHLIKYLLSEGHEVTVANRGITPDGFGTKIKRLIIERTDPESLKKAFYGKNYDIVYDNIAFCSNDVKYLLDAVECRKYIEISTVSVYSDFKEKMREEEFNPINHELRWCSRTDYGYDEIKRQAECAIFQKYGNLNPTAVRFPFITGEDDYTKRLFFYAEHIVKSLPMSVNNPESRISFVGSNEAGKFLAWLAGRDFKGSVNAANRGNISVAEIIDYIERKTSMQAVYSESGDAAPYNGVPTFSLDLSIAENEGFVFTELNAWIYDLLDIFISNIKKSL